MWFPVHKRKPHPRTENSRISKDAHKFKDILNTLTGGPLGSGGIGQGGQGRGKRGKEIKKTRTELAIVHHPLRCDLFNSLCTKGPKQVIRKET